MIERKTFTFDGENSADYGLYISGDSVYNAPNREIDMISIPGRNGQLAIDMGRYENITVTYPAFVIADTQAEFREKIRRIRNWLCSKTSYQRLTDDYNPESFRLGLYKSGLEVEPIFYNRCGEFKMSFDCQPQRFLFEGEEVFTLGEWGETETYSGSIASFEGTETTAVKSLKANITPIQSGSGDPSPSNVRPISGTDTVAVTRAGKNLFDKSTMVKMWYMDSNCKLLYDGTTILFSVPIGTEFILSGTNGNRNRLCYIDKPLSEVAINDVTTFISNTNLPIHLTSQHQTYVYYMNSSQNASLGDSLQLELGSTATDYEPYEGESKSISLGQTVYGGTLEVMSGKLTITHEIQNLKNRNLNYTIEYTVNNKRGVGFNYALSKTSTRANGWCDHSTVTSETDPNLPQYMWFGVNSKYIFWVGILDVLNMTLEEFKTWQSSHDVYVVDELATPIEVTLTPTQVTTLLGNNNIWADSGSVEVEIGENPYILVNPTKFEACPIFEVEGAGTLSIGDTTLTISNTGTTIIDTEMMEAYEDDNGAIISRNDDVEGGFPTLTSGINNVEADGLTSVKVTPKFWEL